ncbi:uncharacterized protein LOC100901706 [Galendromus occidentalis]|uniref:Uncharacterized protein LOC100901706 n=1 Tax=Galendromus occidentalis TaxID=34638 RepID=A0AAJ6QYD5_9ACAR|nr:uncharacterized protein LOC100901706 [Galendromus occidentalis]
MALRNPSSVVALREVPKKLSDEIDDLDEITFDRFNDETFSGMEEWTPEDEPQAVNEDPKKEDTKEPSEMMTLINSSFNSLDLDLSSEDRELPQGSENGNHQRVQHTSWGQKHFEDLQSSPSVNCGKRVTFQQDRRSEAMFPQNPGNYVDERNLRDYDDELRRSDPYVDHNRARHPAPPTSASRRSSSNFGCTHYKEVPRNLNVMSPHAFTRRNAAFRQDNFDLRNVETFGIDAVERHQFGAVPTKSPSIQYSRSEEDLVPSQQHCAYPDDNFRYPEIRDPRVQDLYFETCRKLQMEPMYSHLEQTKEEIVNQQLNDMKTTALEHLKNIAELVPKIEVMEDVFDRLTDPEDPPCEQERAELLDRLKQHVTPQNVLPFSKMVHARRLLMHSLSIMSREKRYRDHALEILEEILRNLEKLLYEDRNDMVFGLKNLVFQRIISKCSMDEIIKLTRCLLVNNCDQAIESKLGLCFIGCLLETADSLDFRSYPTWIETLLPKFRTHLVRVPKSEVVLSIVREPGLKHLVDNIKLFSKPKTTYDTMRSPVTY